MIELPVTPQLVAPTTAVRLSYLTGEQADMIHRGSDPSWLAAASQDFDGFVADRVGVRERWGVPSTLFWFVAGEHYIGSLVLRHRLMPDENGGHIGYHVVYPWQRQGHATAMLGEALPKARALGIDRALLTVASGNTASLRVVQNNGCVTDGWSRDGEIRMWVDTAQH